MVYYIELSQGQIIQNPNKHELSSFFPLRSYGPDTVYYMEPSQGQIIKKPNK